MFRREYISMSVHFTKLKYYSYIARNCWEVVS